MWCWVKRNYDFIEKIINFVGCICERCGMHKISIIVPVHNAEKYLRTSVASLQEQTYQDLEIVLVENASSDGSLALCHEIASEDSRIKVISLAMGDPSLARNEGIMASSGEFIGFIDSDDTVEPDMYEQMLNIAVQESLDIIFCDFVKKYDYHTDRYVFRNDGKVTIESPKELLKKSFRDEIPQSACTLLCRRKLFEKVSFPVGRYYEDTATTWRLILASRSAGHIARPFYHYYRHGGSIVHTASFKIHYGHVLADMERIDFINCNPEYSNEEKLELGAKPLALFYRHFRKMVTLAETDEEKQICLDCRAWALKLPEGYKLKRKQARIRTVVHKYWKLFCILRRGTTL